MEAARQLDPDDGYLTIEELAEQVGMTVRNLREWRTLGLLPRAEMRGRVGYYPPSVVERIRRIGALRAEGFKLELISRMLDTGGEAGDEVMRLAGTLRAPFGEERVPALDHTEWAASWGSERVDVLRRAIHAGLIRKGDDGRLELTSARAGEIGAALSELGLSPEQIVAGAERIRAHADGIAEFFEQVWRDHVWEPFLAAGSPAAQMPEVIEAAAKVRPLALDAVMAIFTVAMEAQIESGIARELGRSGGVAGREDA